VVEFSYRDVFDNQVWLTDDVRAMVLHKHPEAVGFIDRIAQVLAEPDEVRRSIRDSRSILYYRFEDGVLGGKWVVVVVKRVERHYISTLYATDQIKSGDLIWKHQT
jgi:hypothetical protein